MDSTPPPSPPSSDPARPTFPRTPGQGFDPIGMLNTLRDYRFTKFITVNIVQILYVIGVILIALYTLAAVIGLASQNLAMGLVALIFSPLFFVISVLVLRVYLELIVVIFRIAENTRVMAEAAVKNR